MEQPKIKYPDMRSTFTEYIRAIADSEYQKKVWIQGIKPSPGYEDDSTMTINAIQDCIDWENPEKSVGLILLNNDEALSVKKLLNTIDSALQFSANHVSDEELIKSDAWEKTIEVAGDTYRILTGDKKPEGLLEDIAARSGV